MDSSRWTETLKHAPLPPAGRLTERAWAASLAPARRARSIGIVPLIAALPAMALLLPRTESTRVIQPAGIAQMPTARPARPVLEAAAPAPLPTLAESFPLVAPERHPRPAPATPLPRFTPAPPPRVAALVELSDRLSADSLQEAVPERQLMLRRQTPEPLARRLSDMAAAVAPARLRYPLEPLPNAPQASVEKAEILMHADSSEILGSITMRPAPTKREILIAIFDGNSAFKGTMALTFPAHGGKLDLKPTLVVPGARYYQLGLRSLPAISPTQETIVGGYSASSAPEQKNLELAAPPGMSIQVGEYYQSNVSKNHFARFSIALSEAFQTPLNALASFTLHGAVFDKNGVLIGVAQGSIDTAAESQSLDLTFGRLPEDGAYRYKIAVAKSWRSR